MIIIKTIKNILIIFLLLIISYEILNNSYEVLNSVKFAFDIWKSNVFPSIFPFFIVSSFLINYGFVELTSELFKPLMKLFGINSNISFVFIMSMLSGFPSSSKYIKDLYDEEMITKDEASKALMFTHFSNPLFILGTIATLLNNKKVAIFILVIHYFTNIVIGLLFRNYHNSYQESDINFKKAILKMNERINKKESIGKILSKAIQDAFNTLLLVLGSIAVFSFLCVIINNLFNFNNTLTSIINGIFEMTQGLKYVSMLSLSLKYKAMISAMLISFGGLAIHIQIYSIISDTDIKYFPYLIARIIHMSLSGLLVFILYDLII